MAKRKTRKKSTGVRPNRADKVHGVDRQHTSPSQDAKDAQRVERDETTTWKPESDLEAPPPRPGFVQRWIRSSLGGTDDTKNVRQAIRSGWSPRDIKTVPEGFDPPTIQHGEYKGYIGVEGMILCEMPEEKHAAREAYYRDRTLRQNESIEQDIRQAEVPGGPRIAHAIKSRTSVGGNRRISAPQGGREVRVAED